MPTLVAMPAVHYKSQTKPKSVIINVKILIVARHLSVMKPLPDLFPNREK